MIRKMWRKLWKPKPGVILVRSSLEDSQEDLAFPTEFAAAVGKIYSKPEEVSALPLITFVAFPVEYIRAGEQLLLKMKKEASAESEP